MRNATHRLLLILLLSLVAFSGLTACGGSSVVTQPPDGDFNPEDENAVDGDNDAETVDDEQEAEDLDGDGKDDVDTDEAETDADADTACFYRCLKYGDNPIDLGATGIGNPVWRDFAITAVGQSPVTIFDASLIASSTSTDFKVTSYTPQEPVIVLQPQQSLVIRITGTPMDLLPDSGKLSVSSDAENGQRKDFDITMSFKGSTSLVVDPLTIDWAAIKADNSPVARQISFTAKMDGDSNRPLQIIRFAPKAAGRRKGAASVFTLQQDALCTPPYYLNARQTRTCNIFCTLPSEGEFHETWVVEASDNYKPPQSQEVTLSCKGVRSKLVVVPETITFGYVLIQRGAAHKDLQLRNEGTGPLDIQSLTFSNPSNSPFSVNDQGALLAPIAAGESKTITINYAPSVAQAATSKLQIVSDDPRPLVSIPVNGFAVANCPAGLAQDDPENPTCNPSCTPGDTICWPEGGTDYVICGPGGDSVGETIPCAGFNQLCLSGTCVDRPCTPSETTCKDDTTMAQCKPDGSGWLPLIPCETVEICRVSRCFNMACRTEIAPPNTSCADNNPCTKSDVCDSAGYCKGSSIDLKKDCPQAPCKEAKCNDTTGCYLVNVKDNTACDDGNACTGLLTPDYCLGGECKPGSAAQLTCDDNNECTMDQCSVGVDGKPGCSHVPINGGSCSNADECTENSVCTVVAGEGKCVGTKRVCDDGNSCTTDDCVIGQGRDRACVARAKNKGAGCDDGNLCTTGDICDYIGPGGSLACKSGSAKNCDDGNPCTVDSCVAADGSCAHNAAPMEGQLCNADNDACTQNDKCVAGVCTPGVRKTCDDQNSCTDDQCNPSNGTCLNIAKTGSNSCDDGDPCTLYDTCSGAQCVGQKNKCDDDNVCTGNVCDKTACVGPTCTPASYCVNAPVMGGSGCDDKSACTTNDLCDGHGVCKGTPTTLCSPSDACTTTTCNPLAEPGKQCVYEVLYNKTCDAGTKCTKDAKCDLNSATGRGYCKPGTTAVECGTTSTPCQRMTCIEDGAGCTEVPQANDTPCADDPCLVDKKCSSGTCRGGTTNPAINDNNPCTSDLCTPQTGITHPFKNSSESCNDGLKCTPPETDHCDGAGHCIGTPISCPDKPCNTNNGCNPETGNCSYKLFADGTDCEDGSLCTSGDKCQLGSCTPGPSITCTPPTCYSYKGCEAARGCVFEKKPVGSPCDDNNVCTAALGSGSSDTCQTDTATGDIVCVGGPLIACNECIGCDSTRGCVLTDGTGACTADTNECTIDKCKNGACTHNTYEADNTKCSDEGNSCTSDYCLNKNDGTGSKCIHQYIGDGQPCAADNDLCTADLCSGGICTHTPKCEDNNPCTLDSCNPTTGVCSHTDAPTTTSCNDGAFCSDGDHCSAGRCVAGPDHVCTGPCEVPTCDKTLDRCVLREKDYPCDLGNHDRFGDWCEANGNCKKSDVWKYPGDCKPEAPGVGYSAEKPNMARVVNTSICIDKYEMVVRDRSATGEIRGQNDGDYWYCFYENALDNYRCQSLLYDQVPIAYPQAGLIPSRWLLWDQADKACNNAGKRLCSSGEWIASCKQANPASNIYPYGTVYQPQTCNGQDYSTTSDSVMPTGSAANCTNGEGGVYDLSGNLWEWVADGDPSKPTRYLYGGAYNQGQTGLTCGQVWPHHWKDNVDGTIGARCCDNF